jgi:cardiolipin synthase C
MIAARLGHAGWQPPAGRVGRSGWSKLASPGAGWVAVALAGMLLLALAGCATQPATAPLVRPAPESAARPAASGILADIEHELQARHGPTVSGFELLDRSDDGLRWRLALIDSARQSLDIQVYLWFSDGTGTLLLKRVLDAADRGVRVRLLLDDINSLLKDAGTVMLRDEIFAMIDSHPNVQMRLFNPWRSRDLISRVGETVTDLDRLDHRMHNKAMIVDNRVAILGGRNLADEYFGFNEDFNFHDLDVMGFGPVARQASAVFDLYWNSRWVIKVSALGFEFKPAQASAARERMARELEQSPALARFANTPATWDPDFAAVAARLKPGTSKVLSDVPEDSGIRQDLAEALYRTGAGAQRELLIVNAYIIPDERFVAALRELRARGVEIRILTNSLASHDVPAVNSHYKPWRRTIREASTGLYELRHDAQIQRHVVESPPTQAGFVGLHSKAMVVDRRHVFIGSMNFDPRSASLNTEMGVFVDSPALGAELAARIERDMAPANSWRVEVETGGSLIWINDRETKSVQPARNFWQRIEDVIFMAFPRSLY